MSQPPPATVLIVEDEGVTRLVLRRIVEEAGYAAHVAIDGMEALEWLAQHPSPGLILLDLTMPRLGGEDLLLQLDQQVRWSQIPVVVLSGGPVLGDACAHPQVRAVISKPFLPEQLRTVVRECVEQGR